MHVLNLCRSHVFNLTAISLPSMYYILNTRAQVNIYPMLATYAYLKRSTYCICEVFILTAFLVTSYISCYSYVLFMYFFSDSDTISILLCVPTCSCHLYPSIIPRTSVTIFSLLIIVHHISL